ncbi:MAG TPA: ATP-binding protein [Ktedonobacteraceae bacterium]|nr:ATP-binding protein [Ktedonobacteraceae bacterium]
MSFTPKTQSHNRSSRTNKWFNLSIGLRLSLAFMAVILLTGLIGIIAIQQISSLTYKATELNARDLPESITLERLRTLLYREDDLEHSLVNGDDGKQTQRTVTELASVHNEITKACQQLLAFEQSEQGEDLALVQQVNDSVRKASVLSAHIQALVAQGDMAQARTLDFSQQEPLLLSAVTTVTRLSSLEQAENANDAAQTQQDSRTSILFLLALTSFCLLLSIALAILITRSLTKPIKALVQTTESISAGNLDVQSQVKRADEIGRLASAYDKMRLSLRMTIDRLRQERQHTQAIIDASADGIMLVDETYKIVTCNPAAEHLSGWPMSEAAGRYCWEVLGFNDSSVQAAKANERLLLLMEALQTRTEPSSFEMLITTRHGKPRWLAISCAPVDKRDAQHATVIDLHDISQLKAVDQMKSDFVAMVSHELRAPLTTVSGSVETLRMLEPSSDSESYQEVLGLLDKQTQRLRQVVEEVLQLTRFEAGRLEVQMQPVPLTRFLHSLVGRINVEWGGGDHYIIFREPTQEILAWADAGLFEIVLRNVFENTRKYTPQGTAVEVETDTIATSGQVQIRVIDHGPGIPDDQLESIFERFTRGTQATATWTRGYGLGLYISRELMLAQNGSIRAEHYEQGACFVLSLWMVTDDLCSPMTEVERDEAEEHEKGGVT